MFLLAILLFSEMAFLFGQTRKYSLRTVAFFNVENLFDTIDDPETIDEDYTPDGKNHFTSEDYFQKLTNTSKVISQIGSGNFNAGPVLIGLAEVENIRVLNDLVKTNALISGNYQIIHIDSPDRRGIDVAMLYQEDHFSPLNKEKVTVRLWDTQGKRIYTRDILHVHGILDGEEIHVIINHWPSRRGGKLRSDPKREKAAYLLKQLTDKIFSSDPKANIIIMGDFNDDPIDDSIQKGLLLKSEVEEQTKNHFFNPMLHMYKKGLNTLAYRDGLNLFDQIIICGNLLKKNTNKQGYFFYRAGIYNPAYMIVSSGRYKGYPLRSYVNNRFSGGYSDHFPVYIELIKPMF